MRARQGRKVTVRRELRAGDIREGDQAVKLTQEVLDAQWEGQGDGSRRDCHLGRRSG